MIQRHGAQNRLRAYTEHLKDRHSLGSEFAYGPEFGAANNRPAGMYALDRDDLVAVLDELDELRRNQPEPSRSCFVSASGECSWMFRGFRSCDELDKPCMEREEAT